VAPGAQAKRFAAYLDRLAQAAEHADRATPLKSYGTGLLLPGERKSVEPMVTPWFMLQPTFQYYVNNGGGVVC
jgi:SRSO17 transposase